MSPAGAVTSTKLHELCKHISCSQWHQHHKAAKPPPGRKSSASNSLLLQVYLKPFRQHTAFTVIAQARSSSTDNSFFQPSCNTVAFIQNELPQMSV